MLRAQESVQALAQMEMGAPPAHAEQARRDRRKSVGDVKRCRKLSQPPSPDWTFRRLSPLRLSVTRGSRMAFAGSREIVSLASSTISLRWASCPRSRSQVGEHPVELFRILDADSPGTKVVNAFLKKGEGHGPSTMPQCATLFDTVYTADDPKFYPRSGNAYAGTS
jgi:hypothetical protein